MRESKRGKIYPYLKRLDFGVETPLKSLLTPLTSQVSTSALDSKKGRGDNLKPSLLMLAVMSNMPQDYESGSWISRVLVKRDREVARQIISKGFDLNCEPTRKKVNNGQMDNDVKRFTLEGNTISAHL
ncbi:hypothetical protein Scep_001269 [Stephania cephalantha]|uniref:Uncharacterized protein n=1 Tax=Stephania cephalantha TaxID=152367 RepID=A0AAP0L7M6_9MAGN